MKKLSKNKFVESIKQGFADIKTVLQEGNVKLFIKQAAVVIVIILLYRGAVKKLNQQNQDIRGQIAAISAQQNNEKEYAASKKKLLDLEPRFPDLSAKNDWLLRQVVSVFKDAHVTPRMASAQTESAAGGYTVASIPVDFEVSYEDFGKLMANIENRKEYLKVSEFSLTKQTEPIGNNAIKIQLNTIFPKEKLAKTMFKNSGGKK